MSMNLQLFSQKSAELHRFPRLKSSLIDAFIRHLKNLPEIQLVHINPLRFAKQYGVSESDAIELFLHSVKLGLFKFDYNQICPGCGGIHEAKDINHVAPESLLCNTCQIHFKTTLDDQVEVSFSLTEKGGAEPIDPLRDLQTYYQYYSSGNWQQSTEIRDYIKSSLLDFKRLPAGEVLRFSLEAPKTSMLRIWSLDRHLTLNIEIDPSQTNATLIDLDLDSTGFSAAPVKLPAGHLTFVIHSHLSSDIGLTLIGLNREKYQEILAKHPTIKHPYFTAKRLLNHQSFRELFRIQELDPKLRLHLKSLTLVFTDLKGSTDMYSRVGDTSAYEAVRDHFEILYEVVRRHDGAVVKTMGDAVMATFNTPEQGFLSALDMVAAVKKWNDLREGKETLGLKVGVHEGSTIAVNNDDRVDFFDQTVNIAARVQGLAESGEVWFTESIASAPAVKYAVEVHGLKPMKQEAHLKGVSGPMTIYQL